VKDSGKERVGIKVAKFSWVCVFAYCVWEGGKAWNKKALRATHTHLHRHAHAYAKIHTHTHQCTCKHSNHCLFFSSPLQISNLPHLKVSFQTGSGELTSALLMLDTGACGADIMLHARAIQELQIGDLGRCVYVCVHVCVREHVCVLA
jgi:hypothetical protein